MALNFDFSEEQRMLEESVHKWATTGWSHRWNTCMK